MNNSWEKVFACVCIVDLVSTHCFKQAVQSTLPPSELSHVRLCAGEVL